MVSFEEEQCCLLPSVERDHESPTINTRKSFYAPDTDDRGPSIFIPEKPLMGGLDVFDGKFVPWTGGKPKADWSGLDMRRWKFVHLHNPLMLRDNSIEGYQSRREGLYKDCPLGKFRSGDDIDDLCKELKRAFQLRGMDTICYRPNPWDANEMINVLEHYPELDGETIKSQSYWFKAVFDKYDRENDRAATRFLLNSLEYKFRKHLAQKIFDDDLFVDVLYVLLDDQLYNYIEL